MKNPRKGGIPANDIIDIIISFFIFNLIFLLIRLQIILKLIIWQFLITVKIIIEYISKYEIQKFIFLAIKHKIHPWWEIEEKIKIFLIILYFIAIAEAINVDKTNKGIINEFMNFSIISKGIIFWIVSKIKSE